MISKAQQRRETGEIENSAEKRAEDEKKHGDKRALPAGTVGAKENEQSRARTGEKPRQHRAARNDAFQPQRGDKHRGGAIRDQTDKRRKARAEKRHGIDESGKARLADKTDGKPQCKIDDQYEKKNVQRVMQRGAENAALTMAVLPIAQIVHRAFSLLLGTKQIHGKADRHRHGKGGRPVPDVLLPLAHARPQGAAEPV